MKFALLEEWLYSYDIKNTGTVLYKLRLKVDDKIYETEPSTDFGGTQGGTGGALVQLQNLTQNELEMPVCYFCDLLIEYNEFGGTDYRHDQLYCFRGKAQLLDEINKVYPHLYGQEDILQQATQHLSALHSCDAFERAHGSRL